MSTASRAFRSCAVAACLPVMMLAVSAPAAAQNEPALKSAFEGRRVTLRIDMPGTSDGIDLKVDTDRAMDLSHYQNDLKRYGTAIHAGESVVVTLVKVKKDLIEFQLAGGGFGTFGDDTSTSANIPLVEKSAREKELEKRIPNEDDRDRKRDMQRELDDLRDKRERENRRITAERERVEEMKRQRVAEARLRGGSRFNLRYADRVPVNISANDITSMLVEYVNFSNAPVPTAPPATGQVVVPTMSAMPPPSGDITLLRKGMPRADAERAFGRPVGVSDRRDGSMTVTTLIFMAGNQRISADFVEDVLVRYTIASR